MTEHGASEDLRVDPAGIDVAPQEMGAATDARITLDERLKTLGIPTHTRGVWDQRLATKRLALAGGNGYTSHNTNRKQVS